MEKRNCKTLPRDFIGYFFKYVVRLKKKSIALIWYKLQNSHHYFYSVIFFYLLRKGNAEWVKILNQNSDFKKIYIFRLFLNTLCNIIVFVTLFLPFQLLNHITWRSPQYTFKWFYYQQGHERLRSPKQCNIDSALH